MPTSKNTIIEKIRYMNNNSFFLSYKFTGEDINLIKEKLEKILPILRLNGNSVYCSFEDQDFFKKNNFDSKKILEHALKKLDDCEKGLILLDSDQKSEGMLLEIGYMVAKEKPFILAKRNGIKTTFLEKIAEDVINFDSVEELCNKLNK